MGRPRGGCRRFGRRSRERVAWRVRCPRRRDRACAPTDGSPPENCSTKPGRPARPGRSMREVPCPRSSSSTPRGGGDRRPRCSATGSILTAACVLRIRRRVVGSARERSRRYWMGSKLLGDVVAHGSRSVVHAYGRGAVIKVPKPATPASWIRAEAEHVEAVRAVGAPAPSLLGMEQVFGRPASVWERIDGPSLWQQVVDRPASRAPRLGERWRTSSWRSSSSSRRSRFRTSATGWSARSAGRRRTWTPRSRAHSSCCRGGRTHHASATGTCIPATSS